MEHYQIELKLAMLEVCKMAGIPYTNDFGKIIVQLHDLGLMNDEEVKQAYAILQRR
jgi:hypothetical protein